MSYVTPGSPLPPNNADRLSECERVLACQIVNGVEQAAAQGVARSQQTAPPSSFVSFGLPVAKQVQSAQTMLASANSPGVAFGTGDPSSRKATRRYGRAKIMPLNVTEAEYSGCCIRGVDALAPQVQYQPRITIPPAPIVRDTPLGPLYLKPPASAPPFMPPQAQQAVQQSQGPQVLVLPGQGPVTAVQSQLPVGRFMGYAYPAPGPPVAGPVIPFRGMGAIWGNSGTGPCGPSWPRRNYSGGMSGKGWLMLAALGIGAYAWAGRRR
jgi:hypothetical protein